MRISIQRLRAATYPALDHGRTCRMATARLNAVLERRCRSELVETDLDHQCGPANGPATTASLSQGRRLVVDVVEAVVPGRPRQNASVTRLSTSLQLAVGTLSRSRFEAVARRDTSSSEARCALGRPSGIRCRFARDLDLDQAPVLAAVQPGAAGILARAASPRFSFAAEVLVLQGR